MEVWVDWYVLTEVKLLSFEVEELAMLLTTRVCPSPYPSSDEGLLPSKPQALSMARQ
jgi:hypothetical protein